MSSCLVTIRHLPVPACCQWLQIKLAAALGSSSIAQSSLIKRSLVTIYEKESNDHLQCHRWDPGTESSQK